MVIDVQKGFVVPEVDHAHYSLAAALNAMLIGP